jgi:methionyl aminopeptidase
MDRAADNGTIPFGEGEAMSIGNEADYLGMLQVGRAVAATLAALKEEVRTGVTTSDLDAVALATFERFGATPAPRDEYGFPGAVCVSVNEQAVHGIPSGRILRAGDVVKLDVTANLKGFVADAARTVVVEPTEDHATELRLAQCAESAFQQGVLAAQVGNRAFDIGREVDREVRRQGFSVFKNLMGHGTGRKTHEEPSIPNYFEPRCAGRLTHGLVITVEPIITTGSGKTQRSKDGWSICAADGSPTAHHEDTLIVTRTGPIVLTAA